MRRFAAILLAALTLCGGSAEAYVRSGATVMSGGHHRLRTPVPGGGGGITLVASGHGTGNSVSIGPLNMAGVNFIAMNYASNSALPTTVTDSSSNTYLHPTCSGTGCFYYVYSPTVTGAMTFTVTGTGLAGVEVAGFSGITGAALDQVSTVGTASGTTCVSPSITPSTSGQLILTGAVIQDAGGGAYSIGGLTTIATDPFTPAVNYGGVFGYKVQSPAAAIGPTVTDTLAISSGACYTVSTK